MENREDHWTVASLEDRVKQGADAAQIADVVVLAWNLIEINLRPLIGQHGVASLYQRSLYLTRRVYPWLTTASGDVESPLNLDALKSALMQQNGASAAAGGGTLLHIFYETLTGLIGLGLTETLLRSALENNLRGLSAQDTSP